MFLTKGVFTIIIFNNSESLATLSYYSGKIPIYFHNIIYKYVERYEYKILFTAFQSLTFMDGLGQLREAEKGTESV